MKRRCVCLILTALLLAALLVPASAAEENFLIGNMEIASAFSDTVTVTVLDASGAVLHADSAGRYTNAVKLQVQYSCAVSGEKYVLFLQNAQAAPSEGNTYYIGQQTAAGSTVSFFAASQKPLPKGTYYLAISSSASSGIGAKTTVASFLSYGAYRLGDVNGDGEVSGKDVTLIRRYLVGGYGVVIDETIADVNHDGVAGGKDVTTLRRYLVGGYGVTLD